MRKELMKELINLVKKHGEWDLAFGNLTLEECDYLYTKGINVTKDYYEWKGFLVDQDKYLPKTILTLEK